MQKKPTSNQTMEETSNFKMGNKVSNYFVILTIHLSSIKTYLNIFQRLKNIDVFVVIIIINAM
jgi:hypothetical protein